MGEVGLIAAAVAGRDVPVERSARGVHTDGTTIYLPNGADGGSPEVLRAVMCQAALLATQSLAPDRMRQLARSGAVAAERYLALEVVRSCAALDDVLPSSLRSAVSPYADAVGLTSSPEDSLDRALSRRSIPRPPAWFGELHPRAVVRSRYGGGEAPSDDQLAEALRRAMEAEDDETEDEAEGSRSRLAEILSSPIKNPLSNTLLRLLGAQRSMGTGSNGGTEISSVGRRSGVGNGRVAPREAPPLVDMGGQLVRGHRYAEWDHRKRQYRDDWCTVGEFDPVRHNGSAAATRVHVPLLRELARLGLTYRPHGGEAQGEELDLNALVDFRVGLAAGLGTEPNVYRAERRTQHELGVLVLLDATGSTAEQSGASSVFDAQRALALSLTTALDRLGARVGAFAFYSRGRHNVRFLRCKTFDERWGLGAQRRMLGIEPSGFTRLGVAIRHGTHLLDAQAGTQRRLLIVVGDGIPYDDRYEGSYALEDCRRAVAEATARAVGCVGISASAPPNGQSIWPPEAHRVVVDPAQLAREARGLFGTAIHRAGRRQTTRPMQGEPS